MSYTTLVAAGKAKQVATTKSAKTPVKKSAKTKVRLMKQRTDVALLDRHVNMSNALTRGAQGLLLPSKRILALALAKTDSVPMRELLLAQKNNGWKIRVTVAEYAEAYGVDTSTAYTQLKHDSKNLLESHWETEFKNDDGYRVERIGNWLSVLDYCDGSAYVDLTFTTQVAPHLLALRGTYTTYKLKNAVALHSIYAWRLYEAMRSWRTTGRWTPTLDEFLMAMEAPKSYRANFKSTRTRIIEPAIKEIALKYKTVIEWAPEKHGRKVIGLRFQIGKNSQGEFDFEPGEDQILRDKLEKNHGQGRLIE